MKKIRISIILIFILGCLFSESEDLSNYDNLYLLSGEIYTGYFISSDEKYIIFKPIGYISGQSIEKIKINKVVLSDGTIIYKSTNKKYMNGIGIEIAENPILTVPMKWRYILFEPKIGFIWNSTSDSTSQSQTDFSFSVYYNMTPKFNKVNILPGIGIGILSNSFNYKFDDKTQNFKINSKELFYSINLGFEYKVFENFSLFYEASYQMKKDIGGYIKTGVRKQTFDSDNDIIRKNLNSSFIIRFYY